MPALDTRIRAFIAIELPDPIKKQLNSVQKAMKTHHIKARYAATSNLHMTLKFLGNIEPAQLPVLKQIIARCTENIAPFSLLVGDIGAFPNLKSPKVIWTGIRDDSGVLEILQKKIDQEIATLGIAKEKKKFHPHLTLARIKKKKNYKEKLEQIVVITRQSEHWFQVEALTCFQSTLTPRGAVYVRLFTVPLKDSQTDHQGI